MTFSAAIMLFDFWVIHSRKYSVLALYHPNSIYRYNSVGMNWRAIVAFVVGVAPSLPGFINSINSNIHVGVGQHPYQFGWLLGFVGTSLVYCALEYGFPPKETFIDRAILPDEVYDQVVDGVNVHYGEKGSEGDMEREILHEQGNNGKQKKGLRTWADRIL
jgi:NCS1 family nucleobase:cation symporter-1